MSRWAILHFSDFRNLKHIFKLFFVRFEVGRLVALAIIAISLTFFIADDSAVADRLFQSPASPPAQPPPTQPPPPPTQPPPTQPPPTQPPPTPQPAEQPAPTEQPQAQPTTQPSESIIESESPVPEPSLEGNKPPPFVQPTVETQADSFEEERTFSVEDEEASSSNFILDRVELIDSIVVSGAYVWLCCGAVLLLLIPLFFLFLQIRGQIKIQREEDF